MDIKLTKKEVLGMIEGMKENGFRAEMEISSFLMDHSYEITIGCFSSKKYGTETYSLSLFRNTVVMSKKSYKDIWDILNHDFKKSESMTKKLEGDFIMSGLDAIKKLVTTKKG